MNKFEITQSLLREKSELNARLKLIPYDGTPEVKELSKGKYLYIRKRVLDKVTSTYVGPYSDELYNVLLKNAKETKEIRKRIRQIDKELNKIGYLENDLDQKTMINIDLARRNMKIVIYDQAVLEGVATTYPDTETIIDNGKVNNMSAVDVQKILNLKHAWEFILDKDVITAPSNYYLSSYIAKIVNEGFFQDGGKIRGVPVRIGGSTYIPPLPIETDVKEKIDDIINRSDDLYDNAIELLLFVMKTQIYNDGNKRTAVIFANHYLISKGLGLIVIPAELVGEFQKLLVSYYESDNPLIKSFLRDKCLTKI